MNPVIIAGRCQRWTPYGHIPLTSRKAPRLFEPSILLTRRRCFALSPLARATHYEELDVPKFATKQQIKINYYKLSKLYHPDLAKAPRKDADAKYLAIRQAYEVLGNDRKRREYDTSLATTARQNSSRGQLAHDYEYGLDDESDLLRAGQHRGATHAWDRHHRNQRTQAARDSPFAARSPPHSGTTWRQHARRNPSTSERRRAEGVDAHEHRVRSESGLLRFMQVFGIFWFLSLFGGWSVHAG